MVAVAAALAMSSAARAGPPPLSAELAPLEFLTGTWAGDGGRVEGDRSARGTFTIEPAAGGRALLRRDHTEVLAPDGRDAQPFEQIMLVYPESGGLRGDYFDGSHAIHYRSAKIEPERRVQFDATGGAGRPAFRLTYERLDDDRLSIRFEMRAPGAPGFRTIAEGAARRQAGAIAGRRSSPCRRDEVGVGVR